MTDLERVLLAAVLAAAIGAAGCGDRSTPTDAGRDGAALEDASTRDGGTQAPAGWTVTPPLSTEPVRSFAAVGDGTEDGVDYAAMIETDVGTMIIDLAEAEAPVTVGSFVWLARHHYFEGILFHRVIAGFMAQTGDPNTVSGAPSTWGTGGPGYQFGLEIDPALTFEGAGVVGMANAGPDTNGSQFFITFASAHHLDGGYTIFARVIEGLAVLSEVSVGEPPASPTRITSVTIIER